MYVRSELTSNVCTTLQASTLEGRECRVSLPNNMNKLVQLIPLTFSLHYELSPIVVLHGLVPVLDYGTWILSQTTTNTIRWNIRMRPHLTYKNIPEVETFIVRICWSWYLLLASVSAPPERWLCLLRSNVHSSQSLISHLTFSFDSVSCQYEYLVTSVCFSLSVTYSQSK